MGVDLNKATASSDSRCGTYAGFVAHGKKYEKKCEPCLIAGRVYRRSKAKKMTDSPVIREKCGSMSGYKFHERNGERPCDPCRLAINEIVRTRNQPIRELRALKSREYRASNLGHVRSVELEWRIKNPDKRRSKDMKRYALKKGAVTLETITVMDVINTWGTKCHICKKEIDLNLPRHVKDSRWGFHMDHLIPLFKRGQHTLSNVRPSHGICNLRKGVN